MTFFSAKIQPVIEVVGLPESIAEDERAYKNGIVTRILKKLFGEVFKHPRRESDTTFNIPSHHMKGVKKGEKLPNYNTSKLLLPHTDLSFYEYPSSVQGLYCLEGERINTFVSCPAVLATLKEDSLELLEHLGEAPMSIRRVAHWYEPPLYQGNIGTVLNSDSISGDVKSFR